MVGITIENAGRQAESGFEAWGYCSQASQIHSPAPCLQSVDTYQLSLWIVGGQLSVWANGLHPYPQISFSARFCPKVQLWRRLLPQSVNEPFILAIFLVHSDYILATIWLHFADMLATFCNFLATFWLHSGCILDTFCLHFGYNMATFCRHIGDIL